MASCFGVPVPKTIVADPDIAGIGVITSFIIGACLSIVTAAIWKLVDVIDVSEGHNLPPPIEKMLGTYLRSRWLLQTFNKGRRRRISRVTSRVMLGFSDQQLVSGIALSSAALLKRSEMSLYHYYTALMLAAMSSGVHILTIHVLVDYMGSHRLVAWPRGAGMLTNLGLVISGLSAAPSDPVRVCVYDNCTHGIGRFLAYSLRIPFTILGVQTLGAFLPISGRRGGNKALQGERIFYRIMAYFRVCSSFTMNFVLVVLSSYAFLLVLFTIRSLVRPHLEGNENQWGFGQILPNLLLLIVLFAALEAVSEVLEDEPDQDPTLRGGSATNGLDQEYRDSVQLPQRNDTEAHIGIANRTPNLPNTSEQLDEAPLLA